MGRIFKLCCSLLVLLCWPLLAAAEEVIRPGTYYNEASGLYATVVNVHNDNSKDLRPIIFHKDLAGKAHPQEAIMGKIFRKEGHNFVAGFVYDSNMATEGLLKSYHHSYGLAKLSYDKDRQLLIKTAPDLEVPMDEAQPFKIAGTYVPTDLDNPAGPNLCRYFLEMLPWQATGIEGNEHDYEYTVTWQKKPEPGVMFHSPISDLYEHDYYEIKVEIVDRDGELIKERRELATFLISERLNLVYKVTPEGEIYGVYDEKALG